MSRFASRFAHISGICLLVLLLPNSSQASLGGDLSSVQTDQAKLKSVLQPGSNHTNYSVHVSQTPSGVTIKEFVSASGTVFAVVWQGPAMPNLKQLLGQYFKTYVDGIKSHRGGHTHAMLRQPGLVVESGGFMRAFFGKAYLPKLLPNGVTPADLQ